MGDHSHNIMMLGYLPCVNALSHLLRRMAESCMRIEAQNDEMRLLHYKTQL